MNQRTAAHALCPLDGRYASRTTALEAICSELGLMKYRTQVEIEWLRELAEVSLAPAIDDATNTGLQRLIDDFTAADYDAIKSIERTTNHDVKAVELFLRQHVPNEQWAFLHWGCTSEDINNTAYGLMLRDARSVLVSEYEAVLRTLKGMAKDWKAMPMLSRTHGQTATPTTLGKEFFVFVRRMEDLLADLKNIPITAKINGATGTFSAHVAGAPHINWIELSERFITKKLGLTHQPITTQIEPHDRAAQILMHLMLISNVLIDLSRDAWGYISRGYFGQKTIAGEVGSSTMPHKVNPIDFENAEGNLKLSRGLCLTLAQELPISRWQRDLTDSTLQRNFGLCFGYTLLALKSLQKGLGKLEVRPDVLLKDLQNSPEVLTEAVQTALRTHGHADAYDQLKTFSRGKALTLDQVREFITQSDLPDAEKARLSELTPETYTGLAEALVDTYLV